MGPAMTFNARIKGVSLWVCFIGIIQDDFHI